MLTTAGVTFLTSGAKLGSCTVGANCVSGAGATSAHAIGARARPKPTLVANAAARIRRNGDVAFGREIWESMMKPLRRDWSAHVKRHAGRLGTRQTIAQRGLRPAFPWIKSL